MKIKATGDSKLNDSSNNYNILNYLKTVFLLMGHCSTVFASSFSELSSSRGLKDKKRFLNTMYITLIRLIIYFVHVLKYHHFFINLTYSSLGSSVIPLI